MALRWVPELCHTTLQRNSKPTFGSKTQQALTTSNLYLADTNTQANASVTALIGDLVARGQTWGTADIQRATGGGSAAFVYNFTYTSAYSPGPTHTAELPFALTNNLLIGSMTPPATTH